MIEIEEVSFSYGNEIALTNINLRIEKGEAVALLGANGCGKSTLLKVINGLITPDRGVYRYKKEEITQKKLQDNRFAKGFHQQIAFVFQNPDTQLFCSNVYDEVAFGPRQMGLEEELVKQRVEDCLTLLEIEKLRYKSPYHLSGGEKHKVAIACVLSLNPEVLVMDEPMNGLDPRTQRWLVNFLVQLKRAGKTLIISTHNLEFVKEIAERGILFDESHTIVADMPTEELLDKIELLKDVNLVDPNYGEQYRKG